MPTFFKPSLFPLGFLTNSACISLTLSCYKPLPYVETMCLISINKKTKIKGLTPFQSTGCTLWPVTMEDWIQPQANPCVFYSGKSDNGTGFSQSTLVPPHQDHSTYALYSFFHLSLMLYNLSN
jgi:hypothetical protein